MKNYIKQQNYLKIFIICLSILQIPIIIVSNIFNILILYIFIFGPFDIGVIIYFVCSMLNKWCNTKFEINGDTIFTCKDYYKVINKCKKLDDYTEYYMMINTIKNETNIRFESLNDTQIGSIIYKYKYMTQNSSDIYTIIMSYSIPIVLALISIGLNQDIIVAFIAAFIYITFYTIRLQHHLDRTRFYNFIVDILIEQ